MDGRSSRRVYKSFCINKLKWMSSQEKIFHARFKLWKWAGMNKVSNAESRKGFRMKSKLIYLKFYQNKGHIKLVYQILMTVQVFLTRRRQCNYKEVIGTILRKQSNKKKKMWLNNKLWWLILVKAHQVVKLIIIEFNHS